MKLLLRWKLISLNNQIMVISTCLMALATFALVVAALPQYSVMKEQTRINQYELQAMIDQSKVIQQQLQLTKHSTEQQVFFVFYQQWESEGMQARRARLSDSLSKTTIPNEIDDSPLVLLETLGNASRRGLIDEDLLWTTFSFDVEGYWLNARPYVDRVRGEGCDCLFRELQSLYERFVQKDVQLAGKSSIDPNDKDATQRFLKWEKRRKMKS